MWKEQRCNVFCRRPKKSTREATRRVRLQRRGFDGFAGEGGDTGADSRGHVTGTKNRQQAMDSPEMEEWQKARRKKGKVARPKGKLVVGTKILYKIKMRQGGEVAKYKCRLVV